MTNTPQGPDTPEPNDAAHVLVRALASLPAADRDLVYTWLLRREDPGGRGWAMRPSPFRALAGMAPREVLLMQQAAGTWPQHLTPGSSGQQTVPVRFPTEQHAQLREWCAAHGFSMATVIRGLVAQFLDSQASDPRVD